MSLSIGSRPRTDRLPFSANILSPRGYHGETGQAMSMYIYQAPRSTRLHTGLPSSSWLPSTKTKEKLGINKRHPPLVYVHCRPRIQMYPSNPHSQPPNTHREKKPRPESAMHSFNPSQKSITVRLRHSPTLQAGVKETNKQPTKRSLLHQGSLDASPHAAFATLLWYLHEAQSLLDAARP